MSKPLTCHVDGCADMKLELDHLERCRVTVTHEVPDQGAVITGRYGSGPIGDSGGLDDRLVRPNRVNEANEAHFLIRI